MYELLLKDLYLVAITHPQQIHNLLTVIEKTGSARLQSFIAQIKPDADTSSLTVFQLKAGKVAFNMSTKNLASIALTKADIYIANSTEGACIMTRRIWAFDEEFQPIGFKLVHRNGFA